MATAPPIEGLDQVLWSCFEYFAHLDRSNAAIHLAFVRYSPITFRLAKELVPFVQGDYLTSQSRSLHEEVLSHIDAYPEDRGRD